jgi:cytochrome b involved in lipid metabolism
VEKKFEILLIFKVILNYAGRDSTDIFNSLHKPHILEKYSKDLLIGTIGTQKVLSKNNDLFGNLVPYGDPYCNFSF